MTATIHVTKEAYATSILLKNLDYHDRLALSDDEDFTQREGYYLKNSKALQLAVVPENAHVALLLDPNDPTRFDAHVCLPMHLRGCIFENAPVLPERYAEIIRYWSGSTVNSKEGGAVYFQNPLNEYMVDLVSANDDSGQQVPLDDLLSEGVVVYLRNLGALAADMNASDFIQITLPIDEAVLGNQDDEFQQKPYQSSAERFEQIFLSVSEILASPDPDNIFIDLLRHELLDYGYFY
jgi:hypothetical protein